jgi:hypothetical protein
VTEPGRRFVDHPAPGVGLMSLLIFTLCTVLGVIPVLLDLSPDEQLPGFFLPLVLGVMIGSAAIVGFYFWPFYATYYILDNTGITVKYGPWTRSYRWNEFSTVYWQKGMFLMRIGWPSMTPCVRLTNGLALKRTDRRPMLYLTPNDPIAFAEKIALFAPVLTQEMIV